MLLLVASDGEGHVFGVFVVHGILTWIHYSFEQILHMAQSGHHLQLWTLKRSLRANTL